MHLKVQIAASVTL